MLSSLTARTLPIICLQEMPPENTWRSVRWSETDLTPTGEPDDLEILHVRFGGGRLEKCLHDK